MAAIVGCATRRRSGYVLVTQDVQRIEVFRRSEEGWILNDAVPGQTLELRSIDVRLDVAAVYFDPAA